MHHSLKENYYWYKHGSLIRSPHGRLASAWFAIRVSILDRLHSGHQSGARLLVADDDRSNDTPDCKSS